MKATNVICVGVGLWLPALCLAAPEPPQTGRTSEPESGRHGPQKPFWESWKSADTDGDGLISRQEFASLKRIGMLPEDKREELFKRLDKDANGSLSREELDEIVRHRDGKHQMMPRLLELDTDKNGSISFEEFKAGEFFKKLPPERQEAIFRWLDANGDGVISPQDRPAGERPGQPGPPRDPRRGFQMLDENADGFLTFDEFRQAPFVRKLAEEEQKARFGQLDRNQDSKIDASEFPQSEHRGEGKPRPEPPRPEAPAPRPEAPAPRPELPRPEEGAK
jgi:Ca2+-binding EF-hand superfamily protein